MDPNVIKLLDGPDQESPSTSTNEQSTNPIEPSSPTGSGSRLDPQWIDITQEFIGAAKSLKLGELVHDELFGLYEAMSAIEMMDPKMDAGMLCNQIANKRLLNFDEAVEAGKLIISDIRAEDSIGIVDDTYGTLMTWLEGHSLAQTILTNLYLHNPSAIQDKLMRSFSYAVLKLVEAIRDIITKAAVFEEEDFQPHVYGYQLGSDIPDVKAISMLREVEDDLQKRVKRTKVTDDHHSHHMNNHNNFDQQMQHQQCLGLYARIKFTRLFLSALLMIKKEIQTRRTPLAGASQRYHSDGQARGQASSIVQEEVDKLFQQCLETFTVWQQSLSLGVQPQKPSSSDDASNGEPEKANSQEETNRPDYPTIMGFEPLVNQRLLPPTFPRYTKMKSRKEAVDCLERLIQRLRTALKIYDHRTYESALEFHHDFSKCFSCSSCVFSRSFLQVIYLPTPGMVFGEIPFKELLRDAIRNFIRPPSLKAKTIIFNVNPSMKEYLEGFITQAIRPMASLLQIYGNNRARQREKLASALEDLSALQDEADKLDLLMNSVTSKMDPPTSHMGFYSTWVLYHVIRITIQYLLSGFELELYSTHEYQYVFWYLSEMLYGWMISTLNRAAKLTLEQETLSEKEKTRNNKKTKNKKRKQPPHQRQILLNQGLKQMCSGFYETVCGLRKDRKIRMPLAGVNSESIRYERRFSPLGAVMVPPLVSYDQYRGVQEQRINRYTANDHYQRAIECFGQAKSYLEGVSDHNEELSAYLKVAKTNAVVIKLLLSGHKGSKAYPEFDFSTHKNFPIIRIL